MAILRAPKQPFAETGQFVEAKDELVYLRVEAARVTFEGATKLIEFFELADGRGWVPCSNFQGCRMVDPIVRLLSALAWLLTFFFTMGFVPLPHTNPIQTLF